MRQVAPTLQGVGMAGMVLSHSPVRAGRMRPSPLALAGLQSLQPKHLNTERRCRCACSGVRVSPSLTFLDERPSSLPALSQTARPSQKKE